MEHRKFDPEQFKQEYNEYARKMDLFMGGPTTTNFEQLREADIELPEPDSVSDADLRTKLWEVIAGLEKLRVFLESTNHLSDRELYTKLWHETLREETAAIDEIGFRSHVDLARFGGNDAEDAIWLKYYADDEDRERWRKEYPDDNIPAHEETPFTRDDLLPRPWETVPEAAAWLRANWGRQRIREQSIRGDSKRHQICRRTVCARCDPDLHRRCRDAARRRLDTLRRHVARQAA